MIQRVSFVVTTVALGIVIAASAQAQGRSGSVVVQGRSLGAPGSGRGGGLNTDLPRRRQPADAAPRSGAHESGSFGPRGRTSFIAIGAPTMTNRILNRWWTET